MKKATTLLFFALIGMLGKSHACSCVYIPTFCETLTFGNDGQIREGQNVYLATVSGITATGIELFIEKTYFGEVKTWQNLNIENGNGANCLVMLNNFHVGDRYILSPHKSGDNTWWLSECGISYLRVQNDKVVGPIAPGVSEVPVAAFASTPNCGNLKDIDVPEPGFPFKINPTLTSDQVVVSTDLETPVSLEVMVFDATGRLVHRAKNGAFDQNATLVIDMLPWSAGVYFVRLSLYGQRKTVKVVKVGL